MKTGTSCTRCEYAKTCPGYDARMLYGFCQGFVEAGGGCEKDVSVFDDDEFNKDGGVNNG